MSEKNFDKKQVTLMTIICSFAIILPHFAWLHQTIVNLKNGWFTTIDIILSVLYVAMCFINFRDVKFYETETNGKHAFTIALAAAIFLWVAGWAAYINELVK
jgi:hypothetical protein